MRSLAKPRVLPPPKKPRTKLDRTYEDGSKVRMVRGERIAYDPDKKSWSKSKVIGSPMPKGSSKRGTVR